MLTQQNTILQFDTSVLDHVSAATTHHCQSANKECFSITENTHLPKSHMWLAGLHLVCMESTLHRPSSSLPVSAECKTCLLWIFPSLLQTALHVTCCLLQAQHQHAPHLSSVMTAGAPLQAASLTSSPHHKWPSSTSKQFHMMQHDCTALHASDHDSLMVISKAGNEKFIREKLPSSHSQSIVQLQVKKQTKASSHHCQTSTLLPYSKLFK